VHSRLLFRRIEIEIGSRRPTWEPSQRRKLFWSWELRFSVIAHAEYWAFIGECIRSQWRTVAWSSKWTTEPAKIW
jgi:hypothetical protein